MQNEAKKREKNFPSWIRPITFIVIETFLWTTLSFDIALALDRTDTNHLRPRPSADGSAKKLNVRELEAELTGTRTPEPTLQTPSLQMAAVIPVVPKPSFVETPSVADAARDGGGINITIARKLAGQIFETLAREYGPDVFASYLQKSAKASPLEKRLGELTGASADEYSRFSRKPSKGIAEQLLGLVRQLIEKEFGGPSKTAGDGSRKERPGLQNFERNIQIYFNTYLRTTAPPNAVEILRAAVEHGVINFPSIAFEINHWAKTLSQEERKALPNLPEGERDALFIQFAREAVRRGTVERILLGKDPDLEEIPVNARELLLALQGERVINNVQAYWLGNLFQHYPEVLRAMGNDFSFLTTLEKIENGHYRAFVRNFEEILTQRADIAAALKAQDPRATLLFFGALYPRVNNVHLALSHLTSRYPELFYQQKTHQAVGSVIEVMRNKPLRRDEIGGLLDSIFGDSRMQKFLKESYGSSKVFKSRFRGPVFSELLEEIRNKPMSSLTPQDVAQRVLASFNHHDAGMDHEPLRTPITEEAQKYLSERPLRNDQTRLLTEVLQIALERTRRGTARDGGIKSTPQSEQPTLLARMRRHAAATQRMFLGLYLIAALSSLGNPASTAASMPQRSGGVAMGVEERVARVQPEAAAISDLPLLSRPSEGSRVVQAQNMLGQALHFDELPGLLAGTDVDIANLKAHWKIDGYYGWKTEAMVYAFQKKYDLTADGDVGPDTWKKLQEVTGTTLPEVKPKPEPVKGPLYASAGVSDVEPNPVAVAALVPSVAHAPSSPVAHPKTTAATPDTVKGSPPPPLPAASDTVKITGTPLGTYDYASGSFSKAPHYVAGSVGGGATEAAFSREAVARAIRGEDPVYPGQWRGSVAVAWRQAQKFFSNMGEDIHNFITHSTGGISGAISPNYPASDVAHWRASLFAPAHTAGIQNSVFLLDPLQMPSKQVPQYIAALQKAGVNVLYLNTAPLMMANETDRPAAREAYNAFIRQAKAKGIHVGDLVSEVRFLGDPFLPEALNDVDLIRKYFHILADEVLPFDFHLLDLDPKDTLQWANYGTAIGMVQSALEVNGGGKLFVSLDPAKASHPEYWHLPDGVGYVVKAYDTTEAGILRHIYQAKLGFINSLLAEVRTSPPSLEAGRAVLTDLEHLASQEESPRTREAAEEAFRRGTDLLEAIRKDLVPTLGLSHVTERPYSFAVEASHRTRNGDESFFGSEEAIAFVTGETAEFLRSVDPQYFVGRNVHFDSYHDHLHVLKNGKSSWVRSVKLLGMDQFEQRASNTGLTLLKFLRPYVKPRRTMETTPSLWVGVRDFGYLKLKGFTGGVFGASTNEIPLGDNLGILSSTMYTLRGAAFTHVADIDTLAKIQVVDLSGQPVPLRDASGASKTFLTAEELKALVASGQHLELPRDQGALFVEATVVVAKRAMDKGKTYSGNIIITSSLPDQFEWNETTSEEVVIPAGSLTREVTVRAPLASNGMSQLRMFPVSEVRPGMEFVSRKALGGRDIPSFIAGEERFTVDGREAAREGHEVVFQPLSFDASDTPAYFPFEMHNRGNLPVSRYLYTLILSNLNAGITLPPTGERREVVLNGEHFWGWIQDQTIFLEPVDGEFRHEVAIGGELFTPPLVVTRGVTLNDARFLARVVGDQIILERARLDKEKGMVIDPTPLQAAILGVNPDGKEASVTLDHHQFRGYIRGNRLILVHQEGLITEPILLDGFELQPSHTVIPAMELGENRLDPKLGDNRLRGYVDGHRIVLEPINASHALRGPITIYDGRIIKGTVRVPAGGDVQTYLALRNLTPGRYVLGGLISSVNLSGEEIQRIRFGGATSPESDQVFGLHASLQVGKPYLRASPVSTDSYPMGHSPARATIRTTLRNSGDSPIVIYPVGVFQDKRNGRVLATDDRADDSLEAYFVESGGSRANVRSLQPGEEVAVQVQLSLPPDPLDSLKGRFVAIRHAVRTLDLTQSPTELRQHTLELLAQADSVAQEALRIRERDIAFHRETRKELESHRESTTDVDQALSGLKEGIARLRGALGELEEARGALSQTEEPGEIGQIAARAVGAVSSGLREVSDGTYGAKVIFVDVGKDRSETGGAHLGDRGIVAQTEPVLYEMQTPSVIGWKFEDLAWQLASLGTADANLEKLEHDLERQRGGLAQDSAYAERSRLAGPATVAVRFGNQVLGALSGTPEMQDVENAIAAEMNRLLELKIAELRGDKPEQPVGFFGKVWKVAKRPFNPLVDLVSSAGKDKHPEIREKLLQQYRESGGLDPLEQQARESLRDQFVSQGNAEAVHLLDLLILRHSLSSLNGEIEKIYGGVAEGDTAALLAANQVASALIAERGGMEKLIADIWQWVTGYLEIQGETVPDSAVTDLRTLHEGMIQVRALLPDALSNSLMTLVEQQMSEEERREEGVRRTLASIGRLQNETLPQARTHRDRVAEESQTLRRTLAETVPLTPGAFSERYAAVVVEQEAAVAQGRASVQQLEATVSGFTQEREALLSEGQGETPSNASVMAQAGENLEGVRAETAPQILQFVHEGRQAFDEKRYEEAKHLFDMAFALEPFHHTTAYLRALLDAATTEEERTQLQTRVTSAEEVEKSLGEARTYWGKADERLKKLGRPVGAIPATKATLAQADRFFAVAVQSLEAFRDGELRDKNKRNASLDGLIDTLSALRTKLNKAEEGDDISGLLVEAEAGLDQTYRSLNRFSVRITGVNLALSFVRARLGHFGLIPIFNLSLPDPRAPLRTQVRELSVGIDGTRMAAESRPYERSLESEADRMVEQLLINFAGERERAERQRELDRKIREAERSLAERRAEVQAGETLLEALQQNPLVPAATGPRAVSARAKAVENVHAAKEERDRAREALQAVTRDIEHAHSSYVVNEREIAFREAQRGLDSAVADSLAGSLGETAQTLYHRLAAQFEAYETMARAEKGYRETGRWHIQTPFHLLAHPRELASTALGMSATLFVGREEIPGGGGAKETVLSFLSLPDHPAVALATGLVSVSSPDHELTLGTGILPNLPEYQRQQRDYEQGLRTEKPTYPVALGMNFKVGGVDQRMLAKKYLTSREAAYIIASAMAEDVSEELLRGTEDLSRRQGTLQATQEDLAHRRDEQERLAAFIQKLRADSTDVAGRTREAERVAAHTRAALDSLNVLTARQKEAEEGTGVFKKVAPPRDTVGAAPILPTPAAPHPVGKVLPKVMGSLVLLWIARWFLWVRKQARLKGLSEIPSPSGKGSAASDGGNKGILGVRNPSQDFATQRVKPFTAERYSTRDVRQWEEPLKWLGRKVVTLGDQVFEKMGLVDIKPVQTPDSQKEKRATLIRRIVKGTLIGASALFAMASMNFVGVAATVVAGTWLAASSKALKPLAALTLATAIMATGAPFGLGLLLKSVVIAYLIPGGVRIGSQAFYHYAIHWVGVNNPRGLYVAIRAILSSAVVVSFGLVAVLQSLWWLAAIPAAHLLFMGVDELVGLWGPRLTEAQYSAVATLLGRSLLNPSEKFTGSELQTLRRAYRTFNNFEEFLADLKAKIQSAKAGYEQLPERAEIARRTAELHRVVFETGYAFRGREYQALTSEEQKLFAEILMKYPHQRKLDYHDELGVIVGDDDEKIKEEKDEIGRKIEKLDKEKPWNKEEERRTFFEGLDLDDLIAIQRMREEIQRVSEGSIPLLTQWGMDNGDVKRALLDLFAKYRLELTAMHADVSHFDYGAKVISGSLSQMYLRLRQDKTKIALNPSIFVWTSPKVWLRTFRDVTTGKVPFRKGVLALLLLPLTQMLSYYPNAFAIRPLRGYDKNSNQSFSVRLAVTSDPELDVWSWTFGVYARWLYGHFLTVAPEIVGGEIILRDVIDQYEFTHKNNGGWVDEATGLRVPMFYAKFAEQLGIPSTDYETQFAAMLDAMVDPEGENTLFGGGRIDKIDDIIYLGRLNKDDREAIGKDAETEQVAIDRDLIVSRLIRDDGVLIILPNGDRYLFRVSDPGYLNRIAKGAALGMFLIAYLSGRVRMVPELAIVNGVPKVTHRIVSGYGEYAKEVGEAKEASDRAEEERGFVAQRELHRLQGGTYTIDEGGDHYPIRLGTRVGFDPDSKGRARLMRRYKAKIFGLIPVSLYGNVADNRLESALKAFYDPEDVIAFVHEKMGEDRETARNAAPALNRFTEATVKVEGGTTFTIPSDLTTSSAQEAYASFIGELLRMRGIDVSAEVLRRNAFLLHHSLLDLPLFMRRVVAEELAIDFTKLGQQDDKVLYEGLVLATSKLYLKAIARALVDPYVTVQGTERATLVQAVNGLAAGIGTRDTRTELSGLKESTVFIRLLLANERGERTAVGSSIAQYLYHLSGKAGVMRLGDQTFGEARGAYRLAQKIRDRFYGQDRSWTWVSRRTATHGASELGSELFRIPENTPPQIRGALEQFISASKEQGLSIQTILITGGKDLVVVADYAGAQEAKGELFFNGKALRERKKRVERILGERDLNVRHLFGEIHVLSPSEYDLLRNYDIYRTKELASTRDGGDKTNPIVRWFSKRSDPFVLYSRAYAITGTLTTVAYGLARFFGLPPFSVFGVELYWWILGGFGLRALPGFGIRTHDFIKKFFFDKDIYPAITATEKEAAQDEEIAKVISGNKKTAFKPYKGAVSEKGKTSGRLDPLFVQKEAERTEQNLFDNPQAAATRLKVILGDPKTLVVRRVSAPEVYLAGTPNGNYDDYVEENSKVETAKDDLDGALVSAGQEALKGPEGDRLRALGLEKEIEQGKVKVFSPFFNTLTRFANKFSVVARRGAALAAAITVWSLPGFGLFHAGAGFPSFLVNLSFIIPTAVLSIVAALFTRTLIAISVNAFVSAAVGLLGWLDQRGIVSIEKTILDKNFVKLARAYGHDPKAFLANYYSEAEYPLIFGIPFLPGHFKFRIPVLMRKFHVNRAPSEISLTTMLLKLHEPKSTLPVSGYNLLDGLVKRFTIVLLYTEDTLSGMGVTKPTWQPVMPAKAELRMEALMAIDQLKRFNRSPQRALLYAKGKGLVDATEQLVSGEDKFVGAAFGNYATFLKNVFFMKAMDEEQVDIGSSARGAGFFSYILWAFTNRDIIGKHISEFGMGDAQAVREYERYKILDGKLDGRFSQVMNALQEYLNADVNPAERTFVPVDPEIVAAMALLWKRWETLGGIKLSVNQIFERLKITTPADATADGGKKVTTPSAVLAAPTFEETIAASILQALPVNSGIDKSLFISKVRLLDPATRNLVGLIKDRVNLEFLRNTVGTDATPELRAERLVKLYAILALQIRDKKNMGEIQLPAGFGLGQLSQIDFVDLKTINAQTYKDLMTLIGLEEEVIKTKL